ncbi:MAG: hypothetical protein LH468_02470 [Nocardioides sp.]|nr:hypothetical protein [Nocardioides sp.]
MRILTSLAAVVLATGLLTSCSQDPATTTTTNATDRASSSQAPTPTDSATEEASPISVGTVLSITIEGDQVAPNGQVIELAPGTPLTVEISSDRAGELHVHAKPEQYVEYAAGTSTQELVIDTPGLVEVEDHDTGDVVAQLTVR